MVGRFLPGGEWDFSFSFGIGCCRRVTPPMHLLRMKLGAFQQGVSPLRRRPKGFAVALWKPSRRRLLTCALLLRGFRACGRDQRALRSPFGNLRVAFCLLVLCCCGGFAPAGATKGLCDRPLETFASPFACLCFVVAGVSRLRARPEGFAVALWTPSQPLLINNLGLQLGPQTWDANSDF